MPAFINLIGTSLPEHKIGQQQIADFMCNALQLNLVETRKLKALYRQTQIATRHSVLQDFTVTKDAYTFFPNSQDLEPFPSISTRMQAYRQYALPLAIQAVANCFQNQNEYPMRSITHLITVSCTGMYAPGLDIDLVQSLGLSTNIKRTCINFMGCYGAFNALKLADAICGDDHNAKVLIVSVELCTLHFQKEKSDNNLLANALFADGAAAVLVEGQPSKSTNALKLMSFYCDIFPEGKTDMEWNIADFGFEMTLSQNVPKIVKAGIGKLYTNLLVNSGLQNSDISLFAIHPGGRAILEAIEVALDISKHDNRFAYEILEGCGNMSSATVLFVLKNLMSQATESYKNKHILSCAFGPGLTLESMILELV